MKEKTKQYKLLYEDMILSKTDMTCKVATFEK